MFTRAIFVHLYDLHSEIIRQSLCTCAKLFIEEKAHGTNKQKGGFSKLCVKIKKKDVIPTYSIFQHVSIT
jgi:hypothetical protein